MGKTRDLLKKIRYKNRIFHAKMGIIKDRNVTDLTEQKILRRGGKSTRKNCTKKLHNPDNHDGVITHLEPDIWNVKSSGLQKAPLQTKLVEVMEFQLSSFKS